MSKKRKEKWNFILTRGLLLIGLGLFVFFHLFQWVRSDQTISNYISSLDISEVLLETGSMLISGLFLGWYIWRQQQKLKNYKQGD